MTHTTRDTTDKGEGFFANIHRISLKRTSIDEASKNVFASLTIGYILTEHPEFGSILISPNHEDVYVVPPEVMLHLIKQDLISLNPAACGGSRAIQ